MKTTEGSKVDFLRSTTTGTIHAVVDDWNAAAGGWQIKALCGTRDLTGSLVHSDADRLSRNPDLCGNCAKHLR